LSPSVQRLSVSGTAPLSGLLSLTQLHGGRWAGLALRLQVSTTTAGWIRRVDFQRTVEYFREADKAPEILNSLKP